MEEITLSLLRSRVGHTRLWPIKNSFLYHVFYVKVPIQKNLNYKTPFFFSFNSFNLFSLYTKDKGSKNENETWYEFITEQFKIANIPYQKTDSIYLICHPRLFGFAFNPISYWLLIDQKNNLKAVLCEVHSTFGQTHNYLLFKEKNLPIYPSDILIAEKNLYVSPFNKIEGHYEFTFTHSPYYFKSTVHYFNASGRLILKTFMDGEFSKLTNKNILSSILSYPGMTIMVVLHIHWQALQLYVKKLSHTLYNKPKRYINNQTTIGKKKKISPKKREYFV